MYSRFPFRFHTHAVDSKGNNHEHLITNNRKIEYKLMTVILGCNKYVVRETLTSEEKYRRLSCHMARDETHGPCGER